MPLFLQLVWSFLWSALTSRIGQIAIAFFVAWMWSGFRTDSYWKSVMSQEAAVREAAYRKELARQESAAREIAEAATKRVEEDIAAQEELQRIVQSFGDKEPVYVEKKILVPGCRIDSSFSSVVRKLDAQAGKSKAPRRSR